MSLVSLCLFSDHGILRESQAEGAPVRADISKLEPGQMVVIEWRGKPVYVLRRTPEQVAGLATLNDDLKDPSSEASAQPDYIEGDGRAINEEFLVMVGPGTHLGVHPNSARKWGPYMGGDEWLGGFFAPAMAPNLIRLGASIRASRRQPILKFPLIPTRATACW